MSEITEKELLGLAEITRDMGESKPVLEKVITGGQTGIDQIALQAAKELGFQTGGTAPHNFITETGINTYLHVRYGLVECDGGYAARTEQNVIDADAIVLYGDMSSKGSQLTYKFIDKYEKPRLINPEPEIFKQFMIDNRIKILNIAGNRASVLGEEKMKFYQDLIYNSLRLLK